MNRIDPEARFSVPLTVRGAEVVLEFRPLTARVKDQLLAWVKAECLREGLDMSAPETDVDARYVNIALAGMVRYSIAGWTGIEARFSSNLDANLDVAWDCLADADWSPEQKAETWQRLEELCGLRRGEEKNSPASSESPKPARRSIVAAN